jgi:hypothetical protein
MTDIFFSYSAKDRERVRPVHAALAAMGFDIFWDQAMPAGIDWDTWIRQHLNRSKCAIVFWSPNSVASDNVRHEATVAKQHGKLIPVMLDALSADQFPMGLYAVQGVNLTSWIGDLADTEWQKLSREVEAKLTPMWVRRMTDSLEAELLAERARRETAERRDRTLREQIAKEVEAQQQLRQERDEALDEIAALQARLNERRHEAASPEDRTTELAKQLIGAQVQRETLAQQYDYAQQEIAALKDSLAQFGAQVSTSARRRPDASPPPPVKVAATLRGMGAPSRSIDDSAGRGRAAVFAVGAPVTCLALAWLLPRLGIGIGVKLGLVLVLVGTLAVALLISAPRRGQMTKREIFYYSFGIGFVALMAAVF